MKQKYPNCAQRGLFGLLLLALLSPSSILADGDAVAAIRSEIEALRREYDARLAELESRLVALEANDDAAEPAAGDELAAIREAARAAAAAPQTSGNNPPAPPAASPSRGRERNLNLLNPEISMTGIVTGVSVPDGRDEFSAREFELDLQSALDPFSRTRWTIAVRDEGVEIEEGYIQFNSLPGGLDLMAGKFRQRFGPLNRQHLHALPQTEYPLVYQTYFGEEGLAQTGVSFTWLLPRPWASANEITLELTDGENEIAFAGEEFEDFALLARLNNFWELSPSTWFEWGLSGVGGKTATGGDSRVFGTDFTLHWQPPSRAKYRELTWRSEILRSERDEPGGPSLAATGFYSYVEGLLARNLYAGLRYDQVEDPLDPTLERRGFSPYITWWQSEYVRLRAEYGVVENRLTGDEDDRFTLQITWAAGPHKHESY